VLPGSGYFVPEGQITHNTDHLVSERTTQNGYCDAMLLAEEENESCYF
jgi:hypothetical protein